MAPISLKAHFDGQSIRLDEPYELPLDVPLLVTIQPAATNGPPVPGWPELSANGLARAYGDTEPEYSDADIRP